MPGTIEPVENGAYRIRHLKVDVEVGDSKVAGFKPKLKLKRWDGECSLDIDFAEEVEEEELEEEVDAEGNITKIKWKVKVANFELELEYEPVEPRIVTTVVDGKKHEFLQNELGGLEFGIVLTKKPLINTLTFPIKTEGLRFAYQRPLHPDHPTWADRNGDGKADCFCPENVVGSYAVYHATRTNMHRNKEDAEKYKCGKAFHVYRPHLIDSVENETWADLSVSDGILTITLPQDFLDSAIYPVVIDPNFGYETKGGMGKTLLSGNQYGGGHAYSPAGSGSVDSITAYLDYNESAYLRLGLYGTDDALIGQTDEWLITLGWDNWKTIAAEGLFSVVEGTNYYFAVGESAKVNIYHDDGDFEYKYESVGWAEGSSFENPWVGYSTSAFKDKHSIYGTYSPAGWTGKISGVTNPAEVAGVAAANIAKVKGVA